MTCKRLRNEMEYRRVSQVTLKHTCPVGLVIVMCIWCNKSGKYGSPLNW